MSFIPNELIARFASEKPAYRRAYLTLRTALLEGVFNTDGHCTESDLSSELGMSRTPIRKALNLLGEEGMTLHFNKQDSELSPDEKAKLLILLSHLEGMAAAQAVIWATPGWIKLLEEILGNLGQCFPAKDHISKIRDLDLQFHLLIARKSKNDFLYDEISRVRVAVRENHAKLNLYTDEQHRFLTKMYDNLIESFRASDPYLSEQWARTCVLSMLPLFK